MKKLNSIRSLLLMTVFSLNLFAHLAQAQIMQTAEGEKIFGCYNLKEGHSYIVIRKTKDTSFKWPWKVEEVMAKIHTYEGFNNSKKVGVGTRTLDIEADYALPDYLDLNWAYVAPEGTIFNAIGVDQRFYIVQESSFLKPYGVLVQYNGSINSADVIRLECSSKLAEVQSALHVIESYFPKR